MIFFLTHRLTALEIIGQYNGKEPLSLLLRHYFSMHRKHGSSDRRHITHLVYSYFRLGHSMDFSDPVLRMQVAIFLFCEKPETVPEGLLPSEWVLQWHSTCENRIHFLCQHIKAFFPEKVFPWTSLLHDRIPSSDIRQLLFNQPDLFLRVRPGKLDLVSRQLQKASIPFRTLPGNCLALKNRSRASEVIRLDRDAVVQDYSSQRLQELLPSKDQLPDNFKFWDSCCASGGKTLLAYDYYGQQLTIYASDLRAQILLNFKKRLKIAAVSDFKVYCIDLSELVKPPANFPALFDLVWCDAPCSGSGTWGRTPEASAFFKEECLDGFVRLQSAILRSVVRFVQPGGFLLYSTCSLFRRENEDHLRQLEMAGFSLVKERMILGYPEGADSLYGMLLKKNPS